MKYPKLRKPRANLKLGYSASYVTQYMRRCVYLALQENSVDWEHLTKDEILRLIPKNEDVEKYMKFAKEIDLALAKVNTWHM